MIQREYTGKADPHKPVTDTQNRPTGKLRLPDAGDPGDPDYFETGALSTMRIRFCRGQSTLTEIFTQNVYERELNALAPRRTGGNLREVHHFPPLAS